mmetsp:Transcript_33780/g.87862  ORF Transcript_33780/g.87862 Transcript_33780/m.87862 type:complete len:93 (-) Transcript_33780:1364-1642(-)
MRAYSTVGQCATLPLSCRIRVMGDGDLGGIGRPKDSSVERPQIDLSLSNFDGGERAFVDHVDGLRQGLELLKPLELLSSLKCMSFAPKSFVD